MGQQIDYQTAIKLLTEKNMPLCKSALINSKDNIQSLSNLTFPLAAKAISKEIVHKSDLGLVAVNIKDITEANTVYDRFSNIIREKCPNAKVDGILFQEMASGMEFIVGLKKDTTFGHVVMFGLGGIYVEVFKDVTFRVCPITNDDALQMIKEIKSFPLLNGVRGSKPVDINVIANTLVSLSNIVSEHPNIEEIDLNPLIVSGNGTNIVDVRILTPDGNL
ncbi:MAG: acetate--CoA ligase family protein [Candidatus Woesearchaeota archaeon]